jgi:hypothetical protein
MAINDYFDFVRTAIVFQLRPRLFVCFNFKAFYWGIRFAYSQYKWHKATFYMSEEEVHKYLLKILDGVYIVPGKNYDNWQEETL